MRTIALSCNKGGVGKTSISKHIATAAAASGLNVMSSTWTPSRTRRTGAAAASERAGRFCQWFGSSRKTICRTRWSAPARQDATLS